LAFLHFKPYKGEQDTRCIYPSSTEWALTRLCKYTVFFVISSHSNTFQIICILLKFTQQKQFSRYSIALKSQSVAKYPSRCFKANLFFTKGVNAKAGKTLLSQWETKFDIHIFAFPVGCVKEVPGGPWRVPSQQCALYRQAHRCV